MKTPLVAAVAIAPGAASADSSYERCMKLTDGLGACVESEPFITPAPVVDPYREMMERIERDHDRELWRRHIYEQRDRHAGEVHHGNFLRYCRRSSPACRAGLLD